jgi:hypothetical protein
MNGSVDAAGGLEAPSDWLVGGGHDDSGLLDVQPAH